MPSDQTVSSMKASILNLLVTLPSIYSTYSANNNSLGTYSSETTSLNNEIKELNLKLRDLDRQEQTYDREFLDRKQNPSTSGIFYRIGLRTTEDWVMAFFFFSYILFVFMCLINVLLYSEKKGFASAFVIGAGTLFGFLGLLLLYRYA
jgi:hypothetical protein